MAIKIYRNKYNKIPLAQTLSEKVIINEATSCWEWQGRLDKKGYATHGAKFAHRLSYQEFIGEIPNGLYVCHKCDNPKCISPFHLFLGTQKENLDDMFNKGRKGRPKCPSTAMYQKGCRCEGCVECMRNANKKNIEKKGGTWYQLNKETARLRQKQYRLNKKLLKVS